MKNPGRIKATPAPEPPLLLALENSGRCGSVALVGPGACLCEYSLNSAQTHSQRLLLAIDRLLQESETKWQDIDGLAISIGPGSFTGLRIGLSTAKGIAMAANIPMIGVPSPDGLAGQFTFQPLPVCAIIDARKKEVYAAFYQCRTGTAPLRTSDFLALPPAELAALITTPTILVGDGATLYQDLFRDTLGELALMPPATLHFPRAASIGLLAQNLFSKGEFVDPATVAPLYVRKSDAEI